MPGIRAVIFDIGGVLVTSPVNVIQQYEKSVGLPRQFLTSAFVKDSTNNAFSQLECGKITLSEFCVLFREECEQLATEYGISIPPVFSVQELFTRIQKLVKTVPVMFEAARKIKEAGYITGIITNNWIDDLNDIAVGSQFTRHFDTIIESCKVGIRKPDPRIYQMACKKLGVKPHEVVFLDDLGVNLKSAQSLGFTTIKVQDTETALQELERIVHIPLCSKSSKL